MKQSLFSTWWNSLHKLWQPEGETKSDDIRVPNAEQQARARLAFERLRAEARAMKTPFTTEELLTMVRSGRR